MKKSMTLVVAFLLLAFCLSSCGFKESVTISDKRSYLWFSGNSDGVTVTIDDQSSFDLSRSYHVDAQGNKVSKTAPVHYEVDPGKHTVKLMRDGQIILERTLLLGNRMTTEIEIP
jgi:hypothetical protein